MKAQQQQQQRRMGKAAACQQGRRIFKPCFEKGRKRAAKAASRRAENGRWQDVLLPFHHSWPGLPGKNSVKTTPRPAGNITWVAKTKLEQGGE